MVVVDKLSKYVHFIAISHPFTSLSVVQVFMDNILKLHGIPATIVCDRDKVFVSQFWKELFMLHGTQLKMSTSYHPQSDGQTEVVNRGLETYLRCMVSECLREWNKWIALAKWWYNTNHHSAINTTPYEVVYGQKPPLHVPYLVGDSSGEIVDKSLKAREDAIQLLKFYLLRTQSRIKSMADKRRSDREFQVGDMVFIKLQPYRHQSVVHCGCQKLALKFFGPYRVIGRTSKVASKLQLPMGSKVHPTFHICQLKKFVGNNLVQSALPVVSEDGILLKKPVRVLERRMVKHGNQAIIEVLMNGRMLFQKM